MKIVKILALTVAVMIVLGLAAFAAAGLLVPAERSFVNEVAINARPETVWNVLNDRSRYTEWQTNLSRVDVVDDRNWIEYPKDSPEPLRFSLAKDERPRRMEFDYSMGEMMRGKWRGEITPTADGGVMLRTEDRYMANGWLTKIMIAAFFDMDHFAKDWNQKLKQRAESIDR